MAKKIEEEKEEIIEENSADKIAELTISLDLEREKKEEIESKLNELQKKYEDEHKANIRLMERISKREEMEEIKENETKNRNATILDMYDFSSGKLTMK